MSRIDTWLFEEKVGYDWANKKMIVKVYDSLFHMIEQQDVDKPTWKNVIKEMFARHNEDIKRINVNGYYSTIRTILKDIGVIQTNGSKGLTKGPNWDRFYSDEDWSWFVTNTNCGGWGRIVK